MIKSFQKKTKEERDADKAKRKEIRKEAIGKPKRKPMRDEKKKLIFIFNEMVRVNDCIKATGTPFYGKCCTCGKIAANGGTSTHAGHFVKSTYESIRFHTKNVHLQCAKCNLYLSGAESEYSAFILREYGKETFDWLLAQKYVHKKFTAEELISLQKKWSAVLDGLIKNFPEYKRKSPRVK